MTDEAGLCLKSGGRPVRDAMFIERAPLPMPRSVRSEILRICRPGGAGYFYTALAINIARLTARLLKQSYEAAGIVGLL